MNQLRRFMYGRYGFDQLTRALIVISFVLSVTGTITRISVFVLLSYLPFLYAVFRIVSKNIGKRTQENMLYCQFANKLNNGFHHIKLSLLGTKTHKYYSCTRCKQLIRVPRGKGKICITCPKCKTEFTRRT